MNLALLLILSLVALVAGYWFYGRRVARILGIEPERTTPAAQINDGVDYVPTKPAVLFGHHYASIAAAGPIVGPTLAAFYGIVPVWLWILVGVIFIGAVHDFSVLFVSVREGGKSIAEIARKTLGKPGFAFFVSFAILLSILVTAAFLQLAAIALTSIYHLEGLRLPIEQTLIRSEVIDGQHYAKLGGIASTSVVVITLLSPLVGYLLYKKKHPVVFMSFVAILITIVSVVLGFQWPVTLDPKVWMVILSVYMIFAARLPVWMVLQPRDFVNVHFLYIGLIGMFIGVLFSGFQGYTTDAPAFNITAESLTALGWVWPFLFVTIACGACSGAHCLIASGTTSKQLANEKHAPMIGYGGMLLEACLGILVALCIIGGVGFGDYRAIVWPQNEEGHFLPGNAPLAFALGVGKTLDHGIGLPTIYGTVFGVLILEGFVITTIDTIIRLERYLLEELWAIMMKKVPALLKSKTFNSLLAVSFMMLLGFTNAYQAIWPIFGAANQLLAALALIAVTAWLAQKSKSTKVTAIPAAFMVATTVASLLLLLNRYVGSGNWSLVVTDILLLILAFGVIVMTFRFFYTLRTRMVIPAK
ncbi:MAG TPA: carbon starvation CstA family protein [Bacteroidota bacterium]|nr:carbon starvation CstA family protein [Bacteroidota bacterium]